MNPFIYGRPVTGSDFFNCDLRLKEIIGLIESSRYILIWGERGAGKTSLCLEAARRCPQTRLLTISLRGLKSTDDLCRRIIKRVIHLEKDTPWLDKVIKTLIYLRPSLSVDPVMGITAVGLDGTLDLSQESLEDVFDLLESLFKKRRLLVVFDDFQDILAVDEVADLLVRFRQRMLFQSEILYIFIVRGQRPLERLFKDDRSPLKGTVRTVAAEPFSENLWSAFLSGRFASNGRRIAPTTMQQLLASSGLLPGHSQKLCSALWDITAEGDEITRPQITKALEFIGSRESDHYGQIVNLLTEFQMKCLDAIARQGGKRVFSVAFLKAAGFHNPSSVQRAVGRLLNLDILEENHEGYRFVDPFFRAWLLTNHG